MRALSLFLVGLPLLFSCGGSESRERDAAHETEQEDAGPSDEEGDASELDASDEDAPSTLGMDGATRSDAGPNDARAQDGAATSAISDAGRLPPGPPVQVTPEGAGALQFHGSDVCMINAAGDIQCRNLPPVWKLLRKGPFKAMALDYSQGCGIAPDDSVSCWSDRSTYPGVCPGHVTSCIGQGNPPAEKFAQISIYDETACGVTLDGRLLCWGSNDDMRATPPTGNDFVSVRLHSELCCALRRDGTAACWSPYSTNDITMIPGQGKQVGIDTITACMLLNDGKVSCSGFYGLELSQDPLNKDFAQISVSQSTVCGLTQAGAASCFAAKNDTFKRVPPPVGPFKSIINSMDYACGLRGDNQLECWGQFWGNGSGNETCLLNQERVSLDGQPELIGSVGLFKDDRMPDGGLRSSTVFDNGFLLAESANARASDLWAIGADAGSVPLRSGLFMVAGSDTATGDIYCAGPNGSGSVQRHDDELLLDFRNAALLGRCPGGVPVEGSLSACFNSSTCTSSALTGTLRGESKNVARRSESGGGVDSKVGYADGSVLIVRAKDSQPLWGVYVLPPDAAGLSEVLCAGSQSKTGDVRTFGNFTSLGRCMGLGTHTLTGCFRP